MSDVVGSGGFRISFPDMNIVLATSLGDMVDISTGVQCKLRESCVPLCNLVYPSIREKLINVVMTILIQSYQKQPTARCELVSGVSKSESEPPESDSLKIYLRESRVKIYNREKILE